jgi:hypothetical protein
MFNYAIKLEHTYVNNKKNYIKNIEFITKNLPEIKDELTVASNFFYKLIISMVSPSVSKFTFDEFFGSIFPPLEGSKL